MIVLIVIVGVLRDRAHNAGEARQHAAQQTHVGRQTTGNTYLPITADLAMSTRGICCEHHPGSVFEAVWHVDTTLLCRQHCRQ